MNKMLCQIIFYVGIFNLQYLFGVDLNKAITRKKSDKALSILEKSLEVNQSQIFLAMKFLFGIECTEQNCERLTHEKPLFWHKEDFEITKKLLLICSKIKDFDERKSILSFLDCFIEKTDVARMIRFLYNEAELNEDNVSLLLEHHETLFLQDDELDKFETNEIVVNLCDTKDYKNILKIILKIFNNKDKKYLNVPVKEKLKISPTYEVAIAILIGDCQHFKTLKFRQNIVNGAIPRTGTTQFYFKETLDKANNLAKFVGFKILWHKEKNERLKAYKYWLLIMQQLWELKDAFSASIMASVLSSYEIQNSLGKKKLSKKFSIISPLDNFKNYRKYAVENNDKLLPAISILSHDIILNWEVKSFDKDNLDLEPLKRISKLRQRFDKTFEFLNEIDYHQDSLLIEIFKKLPCLPDGLVSAIADLSQNSNNEAKLPDKIDEWNFSHIKHWVKLQESIEESDIFLSSLIYNFHIFCGNDLILFFYAKIDDYSKFNDDKNIVNFKKLLTSLKKHFKKSLPMDKEKARYIIEGQRRIIEYVSKLDFN